MRIAEKNHCMKALPFAVDIVIEPRIIETEPAKATST